MGMFPFFFIDIRTLRLGIRIAGLDKSMEYVLMYNERIIR